MNVLVTYDLQTTTAAGRRRLRRVARVCLDFGQRVQYSVFECNVSEMELAKLRSRLLDEIDPSQDSLRLYRLVGSFHEVVESYGKDRRIDFDGPLVV
ncbi:MAG TPA: CRISPR-associated endonuclease Cas2 [Pirellulales bacterium]|nr:CRISPR-associated endonuclease Cas2 [Pirellulales bacterium]